jgi:type I restriction enzyme M protein
MLRKERPHVLDAFDEMSKILFAKIFDEIEVALVGRTDHRFRIASQESTHNVWKEVTSLFDQAKKRYPGIFEAEDSILLHPSTLARIVELLSRYSILNTRVDVKGATYEAFLRSALPVGKVVGQFFTPREIVDFVVDVIEPLPSESVCDPACGTGGFLTAAVERVWDIIEHSTIDTKKAESAKKSYVSSKVFGIDIDVRMVRLAKMNILVRFPLLLSERLRGLSQHDGLLFSDRVFGTEVQSKRVCLTNPPFGSVESDYATLSHFRLGRSKKSRASPILFLERCLQLLELGGRMAIVVPDPILNGSSTADVRQLLREEAIIDAVIKLPSETFAPYGSSAESSLLFLHKKTRGARQASVFMAEARSVGYSRLGKEIEQNDLPVILRLFRDFKNGKTVHSEEPVAFAVESSALLDRLDVRRYWHPLYDRVLEVLRKSSYPIRQLREVSVTTQRMVTPARDNPDTEFHYIGLGNVKPLTAELTYALASADNHARLKLFKERTLGSEIRGSCQVFEAGDVLFGKLRPYLRKVFVVPKNLERGLCSSEFLVIKPTKSLDAYFLACLLRSDLAIQQLSHLYSGLGRPRISSKEIMDLRLPLPSDISEQRRIATLTEAAIAQAVKKRDRARTLMEESTVELESAFESLVGILAGYKKAGRQREPKVHSRH